MISIRTISDGKIAITSPYNPDFTKKIKLAGGQWDSENKVWTMDARSVDTVRKILRTVYGEDDAGTDTVSVRVTILKDIYTLRDSHILFGRVVARAYNRDSGAKVGDNVSFIEGQPNSSGSTKNWYTYVPKGSIIEMHDVPKSFVDEAIANPPKDERGDQLYTVEMLQIKLPEAINKDELLSERERLNKRLKEIDEMLAQ
jgi:hypothetical protein